MYILQAFTVDENVILFLFELQTLYVQVTIQLLKRAAGKYLSLQWGVFHLNITLQHLNTQQYEA